MNKLGDGVLKPFICEMRLCEYKSTLIDKCLNYFISVKLLILETIVSQHPWRCVVCIILHFNHYEHHCFTIRNFIQYILYMDILLLLLFLLCTIISYCCCCFCYYYYHHHHHYYCCCCSCQYFVTDISNSLSPICTSFVNRMRYFVWNSRVNVRDAILTCSQCLIFCKSSRVNKRQSERINERHSNP